jgi:RNA polymerase subunit RPABC4/transcription elongation factor Spt4
VIKKLSDSTRLVNFNLKGNVQFLTGNIKKKTEFYLVTQNISPNYLPRVRIKLTGPPQVNIWTKTEFIGGIASGKAKSRLFKVFPKENGIFTLSATLEYKHGQLASLPIELRVGSVEKFLKPEPKPIQQVQPAESAPKREIASTMNCSYCGETIERDAKFCPICGSKASEPELPKEDRKNCPNCGSSQLITANFCGECGAKI